MLRVAACMTRQHRLLIKNSGLEKYSELYSIHSESFFFVVNDINNWKIFLWEYITGTFTSGKLLAKGIRVRPRQLIGLQFPCVYTWGSGASPLKWWQDIKKEVTLEKLLFWIVFLHLGELQSSLFSQTNSIVKKKSP